MTNFELKLPFELEPWREKFLATLRPFLQIIPQAARPTDWHESKIGGLPYLPKGVEFPKNGEGQNLFLLAQINFAETPLLEGFPAQGILQFYINDDDLMGLDLENPTNTAGFRVLYFETVETDVALLQTDFSALRQPNDEGYLPMNLNVSYPLQFELSQEVVPLSDFHFEKIFGEDFWQPFGERQWDMMDVYVDLISAAGHKLGGYADFTQQDPRSWLGEMELLFQLDTDSTINCLWGDMGIANFFIKKEDLAKRDFSKVVYNLTLLN